MSNDRSLRLEVVLSAIDKITAPARKMSQAIGATAKAIKESSDRIKELNRSVENIDAFKKLDKEVAIAANAFKGAQTRIAALKAEMVSAPQAAGLSWREFNAQRMSEYMRTEGGHAGAMKRMAAEWKTYKETAAPSAGAVSAKTEELARALREATKESDALKARHGTLLSAQQKLFGEMKQGGIDMHNLAGEHKRLAGAIDVENAARGRLGQTIAAQKRELQQLRKIQEQYRETIATRDKIAGAGTSMTIAGAAMGAPVINAIRQYSSFEDAMLGVQRQVQGVGEVGSASYKAIAAEVKQLGRELPLPIIQLAEMYTAAARMDVPRESIRDFTRTVAMMATAFDAVPAEIAESMGKVANNFKIPITEIGRLADTINYLDDKSIAKSTDIIGVLNRTAGVAASVAITDKAVAALASTLLTLGDREESAGTAINAMIQKFAAAEKGSKGFKSAMGEIGLSLSSVQSGMQKDAQGTLFSVIEAIQKLPATKRTGIMVELVGMEHSDTMAKLVTNTAAWRQQIEWANSSAAEGSMEKEFLKRTQALSAGWERFKNSLFDFNTEAGGAVRGPLAGMMESLGGVLSGIADWMRANPGLTSALVHIVAVTALIVTGLGALSLAMAAVIGPFAIARYGMALFSMTGGGLISTLLNLGKSALPLVGNAIMWVGRAMLMNPIGLAVTAIGVAALLIYKYWEPIKEFFAGLWAQIKTAFDGGIGGIAALIVNWSPLGLFYKAFAAVLNWFGVELPGKFTEYGRMLIDGLVNGITGALGRARDAIGNVGDSVVSWFKEKLGIHSPSRVFAELGGFTMEGLAQGLQNSAASPLQLVERMARQIAAAAGMGLAGAGAIASTGDLPDVPALPPIVQAIRYAPGELPAPAALPALDAAALAIRFNPGDIPNLASEIRIDNRPPIGAASIPGSGPVTQHNEIHIHAAPGMDPQAIALAVSAELDRRERAKAVRSRSSLSDRY